MGVTKVANYNIRFCDVLDETSMKIDLTPAEVKEGLGKIVYVIRFLNEESNGALLNFLYLSNATFNDDAYSVTFIGVLGGQLVPLTLQTLYDDQYYFMES